MDLQKPGVEPMMNQTCEKLKMLRLPGMLRAYHALVETGGHTGRTIDELLSHLVDAECDERYGRKVTRNLKRSKLRFRASIAEIDTNGERGLDRLKLSRLAEGEWIRKAENILITGATGTGKSFIACALGHLAATLEYRLLYYSCARFFRMLREAQADQTFSSLLKKIARHHVLILDDLGLEPFSDDSRRWLLEVLEDRYHLGSTILVSQLGREHWHGVIGDPTLADAILDRVVHHAHNIDLLKEEKSRREKEKKALQ
jgi:DNA replication protein DnaC